MTYAPLEKAEKAWDICVSFPHMKDAYWLGVDYGVADEAKRLGVKMKLVEAGGYTELANQISQIEDCVARGADAVVIGAISDDGLNNVIKTGGQESSGDRRDQRHQLAGRFGQVAGVVRHHGRPPASTWPRSIRPARDPVKVGWFPGPAGAGWVEAAHQGFMEAVKGSAVEVLEPKYGDTGKEAQSKLVEDVLQANPDIAYVAGTAVTAEAATGILRARGLTKQGADPVLLHDAGRLQRHRARAASLPPRPTPW